MKKRFVSVILTASIITGLFVGCGAKGVSNNSASGKPTEITFWHAMGGAGGQAIGKMVEDFNKSHKDIKVNVQFQGNYDDALNKMKSAQKGNAGPDVAQVYDIGTRYMIDSGYAVPVQKFIDSEKFDTSNLEPNLLGYYTVNNKLYSMPFNASTPILYYNKTAFKEAGLDPEKAPATFTEIEEMAKKLTKRDASGNVTQYGYSMAIYAWVFEQLIAKQGLNYANNGNGRNATATAVEFDKNGAGLNITREWKKLVDSGVSGNFGRKTADTQNAFIAGKTAMFVDSTAVLSNLMKSVNGKFEIGTAFLPKLSSSDKGGVSIGGASLWVMDNKDEKKQKAAWEFIKFMISPEEQAFWNKSTGYFPVTKKAYDLDVMKETLKNYPQFQTAIDQLHASPVESRGALLGVFPEARQTMETNIENMLQGKLSPEQTVENAAKDINTAIEKYNKANK